MREQLIHYVDLLFAGSPQAAETKQEILQNTLDRYDDLIAQGKTPEAAYRLAISGIGDINEILGSEAAVLPDVPNPAPAQQEPPEKPLWKKIVRSTAIALYIMCPIPLFILQNELGLCGLLVFVAVATCLMVFTGKSGPARSEEPAETADSPKKALRKSIGTLIWTIGLVGYFILSFATGAWYITWVIFPLISAVQGLVIACLDLKEASDHEN